jgi:hypothetical protein
MGTASLVDVFHLAAVAVKRTLERGRKTRKTSRKKTKRRGHGRRLLRGGRAKREEIGNALQNAG